MGLYIHGDDYIKICLNHCPFADCVGENHPTCPVRQQAERDKAAGKSAMDRTGWLTLKEVATLLGIPRREVERVFYALRKEGVSIPGTWRRGGVWYYDRRKLDYYHRLIAPPDYNDSPALGNANSHDDPAWLQAQPLVVIKGASGNEKVSIL